MTKNKISKKVYVYIELKIFGIEIIKHLCTIKIEMLESLL